MRRLRTWLLYVLALAAAPPVVGSQSTPPTAAQPTGVITGRLTDESGRPVVWARVQAFRRLKRWNGPFDEVATPSYDETDDRGQFRLHSLPPGNYFVSAQPQRTSGPPETTGYLRTYFPGTTSLADAQPVTVASGQEQSASIRLLPVPLTTIDGVATTADGRPASNFDLSLRARPVGVDSFMTAIAASTRVSADGSFSLSRVPAGAYTLSVTNGSTRRGQPFEIAEIPVEVGANVPVSNISVVTAPGATVSGRRGWDGTGAVPWPRDTPTLGRIRAAAIGRESDYASLDTDVKPDGTFQFTNLYGLRRIESMGLVFNWVVKSVVRSKDVLAGPNLDVKPGTVVDDLTIIVTNRTGTLLATVNDEEGKPFLTGSVLLLPQSPAELDARGWGFRATRKNRGNNGIWLYAIDGILPGSYLAAAIDVEPYRLTGDTELMERARAAAVRVDIHEGNTPLTLRVVRLQPFVQGPAAQALR
jgi:hypothetical protein